MDIKKIAIFLFIAFGGIPSWSQTRYDFTYDAAGNQTDAKKWLIISADVTTVDSKGVASSTETHLDLIDALTYYPNPVKDQLFLKWTNTEIESIVSFTLFSLNGALLKKYDAMNSFTEHSISFLDYPTGTYIIQIVYSSGETRSLKIIKN